MIEIGDIVKYPEKLESGGDGNHDFNIGKKSKYAYPIIKVYELACPISLGELKNKFGFVPPQAFSYAETFAELTEYVSKSEKNNHFIIKPKFKFFYAIFDIIECCIV